MDMEDLWTFVEVADSGGVSAAAQRLGISKSMVSRRLGRLKAELGVQLVARTTRGAALTEAGAIFRDHAARISSEFDLAREMILPTGELRGTLRDGKEGVIGDLDQPARKQDVGQEIKGAAE